MAQSPLRKAGYDADLRVVVVFTNYQELYRGSQAHPVDMAGGNNLLARLLRYRGFQFVPQGNAVARLLKILQDGHGRAGSFLGPIHFCPFEAVRGKSAFIAPGNRGEPLSGQLGMSPASLNS